MNLPNPRLDDRDFDSLVAAAKEVVRNHCPEWNVDAPSDPGVILIEAFAYLTDILLYRVNHIPEKIHVELLRLIGLQLRPPAAARVELTFFCAKIISIVVRLFPKAT